jgi:hypothetical protein
MTSDTTELQIPHQPFGEAGIGQAGGSDLHQGGADSEILPDVVCRPDPTDADDREALGALEHHGRGLKSYRKESRAAHPSPAGTKPGLA